MSDLNNNFWRWFKNSKVVDNSGQPLIVYHASNKEFDRFDKKYIGSATDQGDVGSGFYFIANETEARGYGRILKSFYLSVQNPLIIGSEYSQEKQEGMRLMMRSQPFGAIPTVEKLNNILIKQGIKIDKPLFTKYSQLSIYDLVSHVGHDIFAQAIQKAGYDGIYWLGEWIVYKPTQIKLVENSGEWNPTSDLFFESDLTAKEFIEGR